MAEQQAISQADVQSLAQKLTQFTQTLTPGEQAALAAVVLRGMPPAEDVAGFVEGGGEELHPPLDPTPVFNVLKPFVPPIESDRPRLSQ